MGVNRRAFRQLDNALDPAPERNQRTPWKTFLQTHWEGLAAADLFTVEVLTLAGLRRYFVFFVIALKTRRVHITGIHPQPDGRWMEQMARNLTDPVDGFLRTARQLIHDRDPLYTRVFGEILTSGDVGPIRLPPKSPNLNAYAERFVRSIKEECLHRVGIVNLLRAARFCPVKSMPSIVLSRRTSPHPIQRTRGYGAGGGESTAGGVD